MLLPAAGAADAAVYAREEPSVSSQVKDGRPRGAGADRPGAERRRAARAQVERGLVGDAAVRWEGDAVVPRSAPMEASHGRRGSGLSGEDVSGAEPSCLTSDSFAAPIPGSRGAGRRTPRPWGRGRRLCRRQKRRRCESRGLWAPFLCSETESGFEGARRLAPPVPGVPRPLRPSRVYPQRGQKPELSVTCASSCPPVPPYLFIFWETTLY